MRYVCIYDCIYHYTASGDYFQAGASESDIRERINRLLVSGNVYKNGGNVHKTLNECFEIFDLIHDVVVDTESLRFCLREVILDFLKDNVRYLELRTTPRKTAFMNEKEYLETVLDTIAKCETEERLPIMVRILVSVNRALGVDAARANVELACKYHKMTGIVVGIDFSGNPTKGVFSDFVPILLQARNQGLKITVHCAEVDDPQEVKQIITDFREYMFYDIIQQTIILLLVSVIVESSRVEISTFSYIYRS
mmetsp:Transcript_3990/g.5011  ORF Transcript_3990/g.5011 Transcript_3990/m.5011 type:complete len:252 (+) Transcript_3990:1403-2158(+)